MIHLRSFHESLKVGFVPAVSHRALNRTLLCSLLLNPHCMGNTDFLPDWLGAITGTMSVGRTSPLVIIGLPCVDINLSARTELVAATMMSLNSGAFFSIKNLVHIVSPFLTMDIKTRLSQNLSKYNKIF
jgi:hypothetical protein